MADLGHEPKEHKGRKVYGRATSFTDGFDVLDGLDGPPNFLFNACRHCGVLYVPTDGAVCPTRLYEFLKERLL